MTPNCKNCGQAFSVSEKDQQFYRKMEVPAPTLCPPCREQRRLASRNERSLYRRTCDFCQKALISVYAPGSEYRQICHECFWNEKTWDPLEYGQDFDFSRPFFDQFSELRKKVPRLNSGSMNNENCEYTNFTADSKNCYLTIASENAADCYYCKLCQKNRDCADCDYIWDSELCYDSVNVSKSFRCLHGVELENCFSCDFSFGLKSCKNCLFCWNLTNKEYCILNEELGREEYESRRRSFSLSDFQKYEYARKTFAEIFYEKAVHRASTLIQCEDCSGDNLKNCRAMERCFDMQESEGCHYCSEGDAKLCFDCNNLYYQPELCVEVLSMLQLYSCRFTSFAYYSSSLDYCDSCYSSEHLFGCIGLNRKKYCILNREYSPADYENLVAKIIAHMKKTEEWGEFFPIPLSPFAYNETLAFEYYPLVRADALKKGFRWREKDEQEYRKQKYVLPKNISEVPEEILQEVLACRTCGKNYRIIAPELAFYRNLGLSLPRECPDCRHHRRMIFRNPREATARSCDKCHTTVAAFLSPQVQKVYCEECYRKEFF